GQWRAFFRGLPWRELLPKPPAIAEFSTGESMGQSADRLAAAFDVTREEQDAYALRSHQGAARAQAEGHLAAQIVPVVVPPRGTVVERDNGVREDTNPEKLAAFPPATGEPFGSVPAGHAGPLTNGGASVPVMAEE